MINMTYESIDFLERHRVSKPHFSRKRSLTLPNLIELFLNTRHHSLKAELRQFFQQKYPSSYGHQNLSSAAVTKARAKFKFTAFIELLHKTPS